MTHEEITNRFAYHAPSPERAALHEEVRDVFRALAVSFNDQLPPGRESAIVQTKLEEAMFWANAAIARAA